VICKLRPWQNRITHDRSNVETRRIVLESQGVSKFPTKVAVIPPTDCHDNSCSENRAVDVMFDPRLGDHIWFEVALLDSNDRTGVVDDKWMRPFDAQSVCVIVTGSRTRKLRRPPFKI